MSFALCGQVLVSGPPRAADPELRTGLSAGPRRGAGRGSKGFSFKAAHSGACTGPGRSEACRRDQARPPAPPRGDSRAGRPPSRPWSLPGVARGHRALLALSLLPGEGIGGHRQGFATSGSWQRASATQAQRWPVSSGRFTRRTWGPTPEGAGRGSRPGQVGGSGRSFLPPVARGCRTWQGTKPGILTRQRGCRDASPGLFSKSK